MSTKNILVILLSRVDNVSAHIIKNLLRFNIVKTSAIRALTLSFFQRGNIAFFELKN